MLNRIRKSIISKVIALYVVFNMLFPLNVFIGKANTSSTSSAEFGPASFGNLVDPFSGDFNYSIPLMEVPGPGGSYPIVLGYSSSGVNQESDAGWVGLGWNLNIGAVTREMKGLPDDFKGDKITKEYNLKKAEEVGINFVGGLKELIGAKIGLPLNLQFYNNSYRGFGMSFGASISTVANEQCKTQLLGNTIVGSISLNFDTQKGIGYSSSRGLNTNYFSINKQKSVDLNSGSINSSRSGCFVGIAGFGRSLNKANYIPGETLPITYSGGTFMTDIGIDVGGAFTTLDLGFSKMSQQLSTNTEDFEGAGYLYLNYAQDKKMCLMDYNLENDLPVNEESQTLGVPILQADEYFVSGNDLNISFRSFRNDIGILKPETRETDYVLNSVTMFEVAPPTSSGYKVGFDPTTTIGSLYTGPWQTGDFISHMQFKEDEPGSVSSSTNAHLEEHVYFKSKDDLTKSNQDFLSAVGGHAPTHFHLSMAGYEPTMSNLLYQTGSGVNQYSSNRVARETYIQNEKVGDLKLNKLYPSNGFKIWTTIPVYDGDLDDFNAGTQFQFPTHAKDHHIGKFKITSSDGVEYEYGLPVYNTKYYETFYSTGTGSDDFTNTAKANFNPTEASVSNTAGLENLYLKNKIDPFTTSHLLTGIRGHDYVDLKNDGITDDDLGYFMKFNYSRVYTDFKWRTPYSDSYLKKGNYTDAGDNKAAYYYGEKEVFYINSVESKTHIAVFILSDRTDGCEPNGEINSEVASISGGTSGRKLKKLDKIILFNKSDASHPLQTVEFTYSYSLYNGTESNSSGTGKLTLTEVKITHLNNNKGAGTPYKFYYNSTSNYVSMGTDRWGVPATNDAITGIDWDNLKNTYQMQGDYDKNGISNLTDINTLNTNVAQGLLNKITLPSKGEMNIYYESDDYGYVQNQRAQELVRIVGTSDATTEVFNGGNIGKEDLRIYFLLPEPILDIASDGNNDDGENGYVSNYIAGLNQVYFKTFLKLRKKQSSSNWKYDYVGGYADLGSGYGVDPSSEVVIDGTQRFTRGYITVKKSTYNNLDFDVHPIRKAGWQYLRTDRTDLEMTPPTTAGISGAITSIADFFIDIASDIPDLLGYYNACNIKGYCPVIELQDAAGSEAKPSFLRLNDADFKKTGGGHRVTKITWKDNFTEAPQTLGQTYEYITTDGKSSGVATSEPMEGREDNTLSSPRYYTPDPNTIYKKDINFVEGPVNEAYLPAPSVGYSRVVVKNIPYTENQPGTTTADYLTKNNNGIDVYEFYTAKDFPMISSATEIKHTGYNTLDINIPIGYDTYEYNGYSQGFYCELNDMHGKPKSNATYRTGADLSLSSTSPIHKREYKYWLNSKGQVESKVPCLKFDANSEDMIMGEDYEFFIEQKEHRSKTTVGGKQFNVDGIGIIPLPSLFHPEVSCNSLYKSTATNKIVYKKGILKEIIENNEGEITTTSNLYYDQYTGDALLTKANNSFNNSVYDYNYAGHWYYEAMRPMYQNMHAIVYNANISSGAVSLANAQLYLQKGDQVMLLANGGASNGTIYYVTSVNTSGFNLEDVTKASPTGFTNVTLKVMRTGRRNLQALSSGNIESLQNPVTENTNLLLQYNQKITSIINASSYTLNGLKFCDANGVETTRNVTFAVTGTGINIDISTPSDLIQACSISLAFSTGSLTLDKYRFLSYVPSSGTLMIENLVTGVVTNVTIASDDLTAFENCYKSCFTVLNASAAEFNNGNWSYNYADAGSPKLRYTAAGSDVTLNSTNGNDFHYGKLGIFKTQKNYAYQVARKQSETVAGDFKTKIHQDGEYKEFTTFDWMIPGNIKWTWAQELTKVSPYGITLETNDRSGIKATSLVGYNNKTITAQAANAAYFETAFDAFEDHASNLYAYNGHLELKYDDNSACTLSVSKSHTGKVSMLTNGKRIVHNFSAVNTGSLPNGNYFGAVKDKKYLAAAWFQIPSKDHVPYIKVKDLTTGTYINPFVTYDQYPNIETWRKMEIGFSVPDDTHTYRLEFYTYNTVTSSISSSYVDDVRISPFKSAMVSMVYDPLTLWKIAELDNQNFATFYNYDEEGSLVQVKKETINGVVTIGTSRNNLSLKTP